MEVASGKTEEFTRGDADSTPKYSPDGNSIAFLRSDEKGVRQVWWIGANGGEARQITNMPRNVFDFEWSGDSQRLALCADVDPDATKYDSASPSGRVEVVQRIKYRYDTLGWRGNAHFHIFITDLKGGVTQLTEGDWDDVAPAWSPDGSKVAFISGRGEERDIRRPEQIYVAPAGGGAPELWSEGLYDVGGLAWSPEGDRLVAIGSQAPEGMVLWQGWLYVLEKGKPPRRLTDDNLKPYMGFPAVNQPPLLRWTKDNQVVFLGEQRGESYLFQVSVEGGPCKEISGGGYQATALTTDHDANVAVVLASTPSSPGDLLQIDLRSGATKQLTGVNAEYLAANPPAEMEKFWIQREDLEVECRLFFPPGFDPNRSYPLVLDIHGGPNGAFYDSFVPVQQVLATSGYLVLAVNPRGSSTYGNEFMMSVLGDWGGEDYLDLMAAVDEVASRPYVDASKLGVHGYSYGGFMTSWMIGHSDRFRAAVVGAPCTDLYSMYGTSDIGVSFGEPQWGGSLVDAAPVLIKHSPISYAANVEAPVLLLHGEADMRCPIGQSEEYFVVLKRLGKEVEFVRFPGCSHLFPRIGHPKMREEYLSRTLAWFEKWL
jgi:dipeptidyl aminopeptidase/acylaminoacyl peptidase